MEEFIALRCPSCGGNIQVEKDLEKIFCTHCGTQLILKQGENGLLTPMMARDLTASATLKETQNTMIVIEHLKKKIAELEEQDHETRANFWMEAVDLIINKSRLFKESPLCILINQFINKVPGNFKFNVSFLAGTFFKDGYYDCNMMANYNFPGLNSIGNYADLFEYMNQPQFCNKKEYVSAINALSPITEICAEMKRWKQALKNAEDQLIAL